MKIVKGLLVLLMVLNVILLYILSSYLFRQLKEVENLVAINNNFPVKTTVSLKPNKESTLSDVYFLVGFEEIESSSGDNKFYIPFYVNAQELQVSELGKKAEEDQNKVINNA
ncbi:MAG: hypothetical protein ACHQ1D_00725 [Nitrososphaerales archaeon]